MYIYKASDAQHNCLPPSNWFAAIAQAVAASPANFPPLYCLFTWCHVVQNTSLVSLGQLSCSVCPQLLVTLKLLTGRTAWEADMSLAQCSTAPQQLKYWCVTNTVSLLKSKHSIISDTKKIISVPAGTMTRAFNSIFAFTPVVTLQLVVQFPYLD